MPQKSAAVTISYFAEDVSAGGGKTGDVSNHTLRRITDGTAGTMAASPAEIDATNLPGWYSIVVASGENTGVMMALGGKSATANIVIRGAQWSNEVNVKQIDDDSTAAVNAEAFFDGTGYNGAGNAIPTVTNVTNLHASAATAAAQTTAQNDLDTLTGSDGATLATAQALYAPAKAGDSMALTSGERTTLAGVIWNSLTSGMSTAGSIGKKLADWTIHSAADVWSVATRVLTAGTNIALAKGTGVTGFNDLSAAQVNAEADTALADYDPPTRAEATTDVNSVLTILGTPVGADMKADIAAVKAQVVAIEADTQDLQTQIGTAGAGLTVLATAAALVTTDGKVDLIKAVTDALTSAAAAKLATSAGTILSCLVDTAINPHTPTTTEFQSDTITEATADHYNGRVVIFTSGVLTGQATDITDYALVGTIGQFTVTAMTEPPSNNDAFIIV